MADDEDDAFVLVDRITRCGAPLWAWDAFVRGDEDPAPSAEPVRCGAAHWARRRFCAERAAAAAVRSVLHRALHRAQL